MQNQSPEETEPQTFLGLSRGDQFFVGVLLIVILGLSLLHLARLSRWGTETLEIEKQTPLPYDYQIDINQATWVEFAQLNQIGPVLARRIVDYREAHGPFRSLDDLLHVKGIGPKKLEANRNHFLPLPPEVNPGN
ncbi:ComEA family DNA-binding protein [Gimesia panareensis]|nr:helix-hairpin-helix domain-containing protein [Gimesia panareensis]